MREGSARPRFVFFAGKGGTGKSTLCVSLACHLASRRSGKARILSMDAAHSARLILERIRGAEKAPGGRVLSGIAALEPDFDELTREWLAGISSEIRSRYRYLTTLNLEATADVVKHSPGVREHIMCGVLHETLVEEPFDGLTLVDMPATASSSGFIHYVLASRKWLRSLKELNESIAGDEKWRRSAGRGGPGGGSKDRGEELTRKLGAMGSVLDRTAGLLAAPETAFVGVLNPDRLSASEAGITLAALEKAGTGFRLLARNKWHEEGKEAGVIGPAGSGLDAVPTVTIPAVELESERPFEAYAEIGERLWKSLDAS
jgi:anion-transporting  ArsA/GET3 family ATPase